MSVVGQVEDLFFVTLHSPKCLFVMHSRHRLPVSVCCGAVSSTKFDCGHVEQF